MRERTAARRIKLGDEGRDELPQMHTGFKRDRALL
jgi:hypothetical protein